MVFEEVQNLCLIRGDAARVVPFLPPGSVSHIFINFPEPPHFSGHEAEARNELLTAEFFEQLHGLLAAEGRMTILSDNWRYIRRLARAVGELTEGPEGSPRFASVLAKDVRETVQGIDLNAGTPGKRAGHRKQTTTSYFDRLWAHGDHTDRYYFMVQRQ
ncbi:unnamed protein product [Effrenium voratum]|nr:unnamed protein product [Effrenium voratum]